MIYNGLIADSGKESGKGEQRRKDKTYWKQGRRRDKFLYILILRSYTWEMEQSLIIMRERWQNESAFFLLLVNKAG